MLKLPPRHWTEQWRHDQVRRRQLPNRTEFINFSHGDLINDDSSFCLLILSAIDLQCHVFPFEKLSLKSVFVYKRNFWWRHIWRHLHVTMLQCWDKFSDGLVHWSIRMISAKNYETVPKFVKVMPRVLWPLFSGLGVCKALTLYCACEKLWPKINRLQLNYYAVIWYDTTQYHDE